MKTLCSMFFASLFVCFVVGFSSSSVQAISLGTNITIDDGSSSGTGWYGAHEDQEVEPGCVATQAWDLEGFFLKGSELQVVGGFDFLNGVSGYSYEIGDIFLDIDGDYNPAAYNMSSDNVNEEYVSVHSNFGYDYVLDLNVASAKYDLYKIDTSGIVTTVYYDQNSNSNPFRYESGGELIKSGLSLTFEGDLDNDAVGGLLGDKHYALSGFDLGFIAGKEFTAHLTMGCGNDNLMGQGTAPVPEPATMILFGMGLIGIAGVGRKHLLKKG